MGVYGAYTNLEPPGDLFVAQALGEGLKHFQFPGGQLPDRELRFVVSLALADDEAERLYYLLLGEQHPACVQAANALHEVPRTRRLVHDARRARLYRSGEGSLLGDCAQ